MSGDVIELFPRCRFKFTNVALGGTLEVPVIRALDIAEFADLSLVVRVHAVDIDGGTIDVVLKSVSPDCEDPSQDFVADAALATASLDSSAQPGDLEVVSLSPDFGGHIQVRVKGDRPTGTKLEATLSAELVARTSARPADLSDVAPEDVTRATATAGTSAQVARADHKHDVSTGTASEITDSSNSEGSASSLARSDHGHAHGSRGGGSLHSAATTSVAGFISSSDKTKLDKLPLEPVAITSTTAAATDPTLYLCSPSSSNIDVDLPSASGNSGLRIGVKLIDNASYSRTVDVDPGVGDTIDGVSGVVRLYVEGDYLEVESDGSNWHVVVDGRIAHRANMRNTVAQSILNNTVTEVDFNTSDVDVGGISVTGSDKFDIKRDGSYLVSCSIVLYGIDDQERMSLRFRVNGVSQNYVDIWASGSNRELAVSLTALVELQAGDDVTAHVYHNEGTTRSTSTTLEDQPRFSIVEIMPSAVVAP